MDEMRESQGNDAGWTPAGRVSDRIRKVRRGGIRAWFVPGATPGEAALSWPGAFPPEETVVREEDGTSVPGLLVPRLPGGLLSDYLGRHAPLGPGRTVTLGLAVLDALGRAPAAALGSRLEVGRFAFDAHGRLHVVPGLVSAPEEPSNRRRLGEILYWALGGRPWEQVLVPLVHLRPEVPVPARELVDSLLTSEDEVSDAHLVAEATRGLRLVADPETLSFSPYDPEVPIAEALTGVLDLEPLGEVKPPASQAAVSAPHGSSSGLLDRLRGGSPTSGSVEKDDSGKTDVLSRIRRAGVRRPESGSLGEEPRTAGARGERVRAERSRRRRVRRAVLASAVLLGFLGCGSLVLGLAAPGTGSAPESAVAGGDTRPREADEDSVATRNGSSGGASTPTHPGPQASTSLDGVGGVAELLSAPTIHDPTTPEEAFEVLTRARQWAIEGSRTESLHDLTVPGSPARALDDAATDALPPTDRGTEEKDGTVSEDGKVRTATTANAVELREVGTVHNDGTRAVLELVMRETGADGVPHDRPVRVDLRFTAEGWRVHEVGARD